MMEGMGGGGMGFGMGFGWIIWIVLIGLIIWAVKSVMDSQSRSSIPGPKQESALDILEKRFAKGEIDSEEYNKRRKQLLA